MIDALSTLCSPAILLIMTAGVFGGLVVGAIPGLTSTMAVALLVPITFTMPMDISLALLVSTYVGAISGGLVAATLLNIPGTPASVTTTFDAYPMAARGNAGKALSYGVFASFIGSLFSTAVLGLAAPPLGAVALSFNAYEYLALIIFTLTCIIAISGKSLTKGTLSACLGIFMGLIGFSATDSVARFTFDSKYLEAGFAVMPVLIGMYAMSQILEDIGGLNAPVKALQANFSLREFARTAYDCLVRSPLNLLRSSVIGVCIGILPGVGPNLASILSYSQAKAAAPNPDTFGTGDPDGIISSEAANNACTGGAVVPLLTLGLPGDATTMMMLGAFMIHNVQPGPLLFRDQPDIFYTILAAFLISSFLMLLLQILNIRLLIKALSIPRGILYPIIMSMCVVGCFALNSSMFDVWVFTGMGIAGYILERLDFPLLPLVLGLILGPMMEVHLSACWVMSGHSLWGITGRPVAAGFLVLAAVSVAYSLRKRRQRAAA